MYPSTLTPMYTCPAQPDQPRPAARGSANRSLLEALKPPSSQS